MCAHLQIPQLPNPPPDVERNPTLLAEYESIAGQIKASCHQVALLDRVHNIKVRSPTHTLLQPPQAGQRISRVQVTFPP
jgi:hypothetical protein